MTVTYATGKSPVPNFIGSAEQRARDDAKEAGFDSVQVVEEQSNEHPAGTVFRQNPDAGKVVDRTADIRLVIAQAPPEPTIPPTSSAPPTSAPPSTAPPSPSASPS